MLIRNYPDLCALHHCLYSTSLGKRITQVLSAPECADTHMFINTKEHRTKIGTLSAWKVGSDYIDYSCLYFVFVFHVSTNGGTRFNERGNISSAISFIIVVQIHVCAHNQLCSVRESSNAFLCFYFRWQTGIYISNFLA